MVRPLGSASCPDDHCASPSSRGGNGSGGTPGSASRDAADDDARDAPSSADDATSEGGDGDAAPDGELDATIDATPVSLRRGLLLWLRFDDASGSALPRDDGGAANRTKVVGLDVSKTWIDGKAGGGFDFGAGDRKGHLEVASSTSLNRVGVGLTIAGWLWRGARSGDATRETILSRRASGTGTPLYRLLVDGNDRLVFFANDRPGYALQVTGQQPLPADQWVHVAVTLGGGEARIYVDGVAAVSRDYNIPLVADLSPLVIGASQAPSNATQFQDFYLGRLDELMLYDRALSASELGRLVAGEQP